MDFDGSPGHWVGSVGMNTILCVISLLLTIVVSTLFLWPDLKVIPMLLPALIVGFVSPILLYPISQTLWTAIDLIIRKENKHSATEGKHDDGDHTKKATYHLQ